jgi:hypothetical protein
LLGLIAASPARAQTSPARPARPARPAIDNRIPIAAVDARGVFSFLGKDPITATGLFLAPENLPSKAFGLEGGAHIYPVRGRAWALGVGAEAIVVRNSFEPIDPTTKKPTGDVFKRRLRGVSGQLSVNFGHKAGWSYLTAGLGPMSFESYLEKTTLVPDGLRTTTLNFGGGARWFNFDHLAFTVDMRFYRTKAALATLNTAARSSHSVLVMSAGMSIK